MKDLLTVYVNGPAKYQSILDRIKNNPADCNEHGTRVKVDSQIRKEVRRNQDFMVMFAVYVLDANGNTTRISLERERFVKVK